MTDLPNAAEVDTQDYLKLIAWFQDPNRKPSQIAFTAGWARNAASAFEASGLATLLESRESTQGLGENASRHDLEQIEQQQADIRAAEAEGEENFKPLEQVERDRVTAKGRTISVKPIEQPQGWKCDENFSAYIETFGTHDLGLEVIENIAHDLRLGRAWQRDAKRSASEFAAAVEANAALKHAMIEDTQRIVTLEAALREVWDLLSFHDGSQAPEKEGDEPTVRVNYEDLRNMVDQCNTALGEHATASRGTAPARTCSESMGEEVKDER